MRLQIWCCLNEKVGAFDFIIIRRAGQSTLKVEESTHLPGEYCRVIAVLPSIDGVGATNDATHLYPATNAS